VCNPYPLHAEMLEIILNRAFVMCVSVRVSVRVCVCVCVYVCV